jgi:Uma2 family endonuclease
MALPDYPMISVQDYLTLDSVSQVRYEYLDGELRMQAGGSMNHSRISVETIVTLSHLLQDSSCEVYNSDVRVKLSESRYVYPDVVVSCDTRDQDQGNMIRYPRVIFEVLSPSTEAFDRGQKFAAYRECSSLQEYVLINSQQKLVEIYTRDGTSWTLRTFRAKDEVELTSLAIHFPIAALYRRTKL